MPDLHHKPTPEELDAQIQKSQEDLEKLDSEENKEEVIPEDKEEESSAEETQEQEAEQEEVSGDEEENKEEVDYKEKFKGSTTEGIRLKEDEKKINEAFHEANNIQPPTEDELKSEYPEWDEMTVTERRLASDNLTNKRKLNVIEKAASERRAVNQWVEKVDEFLDNPKTYIYHPDMEGKAEDFKTYANDKSRRNINLSILVSSFLYDSEKGKVHHKGKMFETSSGGPNEKPQPKSDKLTVEQGKILRESNYKEYKKKLLAGQIADQ